MRWFAIALAALVLAGPVAAEPRVGQILRAEGGGVLDRDALARDLGAAAVVIVGEVHDNPIHHLNQAWLISRLAPGALVAEMLQAADEDRIRDHLAGGGAAEGIGALVRWDKTGWPAWEIYAPIFTALPEGAAIAGAAMPRKVVRRVMTEPASALIEDPRLKAALDERLPRAVQVAMEREMVDSHCGELPVDMAPMMVEVQRLRDASLAAAVLRLVEAGAGRIVVVTGNGHARTDRGLPAVLARAAPELAVVSVGQIETGGEGDPAAEPFDYVWITERHDRPDPCERLRNRKK